jgi:hypothetical protein
MEGGKERKTIGEIIRKDLKVNGFDEDMIYDRMLYHCLICIDYST